MIAYAHIREAQALTRDLSPILHKKGPLSLTTLAWFAARPWQVRQSLQALYPKSSEQTPSHLLNELRYTIHNMSPDQILYALEMPYIEELKTFAQVDAHDNLDQKIEDMVSTGKRFTCPVQTLYTFYDYILRHQRYPLLNSVTPILDIISMHNPSDYIKCLGTWIQSAMGDSAYTQLYVADKLTQFVQTESPIANLESMANFILARPIKNLRQTWDLEIIIRIIFKYERPDLIEWYIQFLHQHNIQPDTSIMVQECTRRKLWSMLDAIIATGCIRNRRRELLWDYAFEKDNIPAIECILEHSSPDINTILKACFEHKANRILRYTLDTYWKPRVHPIALKYIKQIKADGNYVSFLRRAYPTLLRMDLNRWRNQETRY